MLDIQQLKKIVTEPFIIGVSGGVDSMALLDIIVNERNNLPKFRAVHVNHNINQESLKWSSFVEQKCKEYNVDYSINNVHIPNKGNLEYSARKARYAVFSKQSECFVILAHHRNDQLETFFLKLFRGAGAKGLKGMTYDSKSWANPNQRLVRPLIGISREEIEQYAEENSLDWIEDPSNTDTRYDRNWIRAKLLPLIMDRFPISDINIIRSMRFMDENYILVRDLAKIDLNSVKVDGLIDWHRLIKLSDIRIKNLLLYILEEENIGTYSTAQIEQWTKSIKKSDVNSRIELRFDNLRIYKKGYKIYIERI